jgi:hypothetical protein
MSTPDRAWSRPGPAWGSQDAATGSGALEPGCFHAESGIGWRSNTGILHGPRAMHTPGERPNPDTPENSARSVPWFSLPGSTPAGLVFEELAPLPDLVRPPFATDTTDCGVSPVRSLPGKDSLVRRLLR